MAIYSIDELIKIISKWEGDLNDFYHMIEEKLDDPQAKQLVGVLKGSQEKAIETLGQINAEDYKNIEFDKNLPKYDHEDIFDLVQIESDANANEILDKVLAFEEELLKTYEHIRDTVVFQKAKDLFDMLVQYKLGQIKSMSQYYSF